MSWHMLSLAVFIATVSPAAPSWSDGLPDRSAPPAPEGEPARLYLAIPLDQQGKLADALPLYRAQAEMTLTKSDRLRYAAALLRAGRAEEAGVIYDQVSREVGSVEHGGKGGARGAAICASSLLASGFPGLAVPYARQAHKLQPNDPTLSLLLVRALAASGDLATARGIVEDIGRDPSDWVIGPRIELARWQLLTGDAPAARRSLRGDLPESVAQMYRDSILANVPFQAGDWKTAAETLAASERKVPPGLGDTRVDRAWRNTQRELWWAQLRRGISLWKIGNSERAAREATNAQRSDEEYVRSAATLLLVANDLAHGERTAASERMSALGGHDLRFAGTPDAIAAGLAGDADPDPVAAKVLATLGQLDRSADFVAQPLRVILADALRTHSALPLSCEALPETASR